MVISRRLGLGLNENAHAWLELDNVVVTWEETLAGHFVLAGGAASHRITKPVHANLLHYSDEEHRSHGTLARLLLLPGPCVVKPGTRQRFPLRIPFPAGVPFHGSVSLRIGFRSGLWSQWNQELSLLIQVVPPATCVMIAQQFAELTGMSVQEWELTAGGKIRARFQAADRRALFHSARLELTGPRIPQLVHLFVVATPRGRSVEKLQLSIQLCDSDPARIHKPFSDLLRRAGFRPGGAHDLPLPAGVPTWSGNDLPLPSPPQAPNSD